MRLVDDGVHVLTLTVAAGGRLRLPSQAPPSYSFADGVLRRTTWTTSSEGTAGGSGGATLVLGDHPMADELRSLGLPRRAAVLLVGGADAGLVRRRRDRPGPTAGPTPPIRLTPGASGPPSG